eukprot:scaffold28118_cov70-Phaeocystis_antarctica.AAC.13
MHVPRLHAVCAYAVPAAGSPSSAAPRAAADRRRDAPRVAAAGWRGGAATGWRRPRDSSAASE